MKRGKVRKTENDGQRKKGKGEKTGKRGNKMRNKNPNTRSILKCSRSCVPKHGIFQTTTMMDATTATYLTIVGYLPRCGTLSFPYLSYASRLLSAAEEQSTI